MSYIKYTYPPNIWFVVKVAAQEHLHFSPSLIFVYERIQVSKGQFYQWWITDFLGWCTYHLTEVTGVQCDVTFHLQCNMECLVTVVFPFVPLSGNPFFLRFPNLTFSKEKSYPSGRQWGILALNDKCSLSWPFPLWLVKWTTGDTRHSWLGIDLLTYLKVCVNMWCNDRFQAFCNF